MEPINVKNILLIFFGSLCIIYTFMGPPLFSKKLQGNKTYSLEHLLVDKQSKNGPVHSVKDAIPDSLRSPKAESNSVK
jgi:hypothetical protein